MLLCDLWYKENVLYRCTVFSASSTGDDCGDHRATLATNETRRELPDTTLDTNISLGLIHGETKKTESICVVFAWDMKYGGGRIEAVTYMA